MIIKILNTFLFPFSKFRDLLVELMINNNTSEKKRFQIIYKFGYWKPFYGGSYSGQGSGISSTKNISKELPVFLKEFNIASILDIPCGDLYWMSKIDLNGAKYVGADIVPEIIKKNLTKSYSENKDFMILNLIEDDLPLSSLIFVRDCLVHLENHQITKAIENVIKSNSIYFASTTYPLLKKNANSFEKDRWRPINLTLPPFSLPAPIKYLDDSCSHIPADLDKKIGIWKIDELRLVR